jgi:glyoxylase-like metal-dependent hydrolase (beta-lactamase superfamily II)
LALAGAGRGGIGLAVAQETSSLAVTRLRPGLTQIGGAGGNVVAAAGDTVALVDSGRSESVADMRKVLAAVTGRETVDVLFNTHWHLAHTGGNDAFGRSGAKIVAHENTRLWMSTQFYVRWEDRTYLPRASEAQPNETFFSSEPQPIALDVGGRRLEYGHLENAHTDGDIYVRFPDDNVVVAGGAVAVDRYPVPDYATGGWIDGLADATAALIDLVDDETLIVPGAGPVQNRAQLRAQHEMVTTLRERIAEHMRHGLSVDEMMAQGVTADFDDNWGGTELGRLFVANAYVDLAWRGPGGSL